MYKKQTILAIIPARGGSKSVPKKNIYPLLKKPLIYYSIKSAQDSKLLDRVIVSTDSYEISAIAKKYGAEVPFLRPAKYSQDKSHDIEFYQHCLKWLKKNKNFEPDLVCNLRPTAPFRTGKLIDQCIKKVIDTQADGLKTVALTDKHPHKMWQVKKNGIMESYLKTKFRLEKGPDVPRQLLDQVYWQNAVVDITKPKFILKENRVFGDKLCTVIMDLEDSIDLDNLLDFKLARIIMRARKRSK